VRYYAVALAVVLAAVLATPAQAAECCDETCKVTCRTVVVNAGDDEGLVALDECEGGKVITISEDGKKKVIKLKDGKLLDVDEKLDADTRIKLLDAKIAHLKATGQLKTNLAIMRAEAEKLGLARKPDAEIAAKKKEADALKARLEHARQNYRQAVKKLVPEDMYELYMLGIGDEAGLLELDLNLPAGSEKRIIKRIELRDDGEDSD
jgi:hypothetical protein